MRPALIAVGISITLGCGYFAVRDAELDGMRTAVAAADPLWLLPALALLALATLIRALRWQVLFPPEGRPPFWPALRALLISHVFNAIMPARAGEAVRVVMLHGFTGISRVQTTGTVVVERAYDVLSLLLLLLVLVPWLPHLAWLRGAAVTTAVLVVALGAVVAVLLFFGARPVRTALRPLARPRLFSPERVDAAAESLHRGLQGFVGARMALEAAALTVASWLALAGSTWFVARSFGLPLSAAAVVLVVICSNLAMVVPSAPGNVGTYEAAVLLALSPYAVSASVALSFALTLHAVNLVPLLGAGLVVAPHRPKRSAATPSP